MKWEKMVRTGVKFGLVSGATSWTEKSIILIFPFIWDLPHSMFLVKEILESLSHPASSVLASSLDVGKGWLAQTAGSKQGLSHNGLYWFNLSDPHGMSSQVQSSFIVISFIYTVHSETTGFLHDHCISPGPQCSSRSMMQHKTRQVQTVQNIDMEKRARKTQEQQNSRTNQCFLSRGSNDLMKHMLF